MSWTTKSKSLVVLGIVAAFALIHLAYNANPSGNLSSSATIKPSTIARGTSSRGVSQWVPVAQATTSTFHIIGDRVYVGGKTIPDADPRSFVVLYANRGDI